MFHLSVKTKSHTWDRLVCMIESNNKDKDRNMIFEALKELDAKDRKRKNGIMLNR